MPEMVGGETSSVTNSRDEEIEELRRRLSEAESALRAMISGEVDAVADPRSATPVLLQEAQAALRESEARYRELVAQSPAIVCELAPDGTTLFVNNRVTVLLGYRPSDLVGKNWWDSLVSVDQRDRTHALWSYLRDGNIRELEIPIVAVDGTAKQIQWNCVTRRAREGTLANVVAFGVDITERKRAEESSQRLAAEQGARAEAEAAEQRAELLAEASRVLSSSLDYEATLASVAGLVVPTLGDWCAVDILEENGDVRRLAVRHADPQKVSQAEDLRRRFPPDAAAPKGVMRVLRTGESELYPDIAELLGITARDDDHRRLLHDFKLRSAIIVPLTVRNTTVGAITLASAESGRRYDESDLRIAEDLGNRVAVAIENARLYREARAARAAAEAANKAKAEFLANMSHELRTPLNAIAGYTQLLDEEIQGPVNEKQREYLRRIRRSQEHLLGLINNILGYAKLESGHVEFNVTDMPLDSALAEVHDLVAPLVEAKGLRYENRGCQGDLVVRADRDKVRQILLNLVSNAVKFTPVAGQLAIECGAEGSHASIVVHDTGIGVPLDELKAIFEPFVQVGKGTNREGTGLGLAISRELARGMDGDLTATSVSGEGSIFTLTLPLAAATENTEVN